MKKKIKIYMIHPFVKDVVTLCNYLHIGNLEKKEYELVWENNNPQYLISSEHIYTSRRAWDEFVRLYTVSDVHIYYSGECIVPDLNIFDYVTTFDMHLICDDRVCRVPTRLFFERLIFKKNNELVNRPDLAMVELKKKKLFCNFIYSNSNGHSQREKIFHTINQYMHVDSLGKFLNNKRIDSELHGRAEWRMIIEEAIRIKSNYKFSIACENAGYAGYTTEKLLSSFEAHTVPIYWGNKYVVEEFNEKAFINCNNVSSGEELIEIVRNVNEDEKKWCDMICQPWMTEKQEKEEEESIRKYLMFWDNIFEQTASEAKRVGEGFHPNNYIKWFFEY